MSIPLRPGDAARIAVPLMVVAVEPSGEVAICQIGTSDLYRVPARWLAADLRIDSDRLTARQLEALELLAEGLSNKEIGERLSRSAQTVKNHLTTAYRRIGVSGRTEAVRWVIEHAAEQPPAEGQPR